MHDGQSTIERALELARAGRSRSIDDIRRTLKSERYEGIDAHLSGTAIKKQLQAAINAAISPGDL